MEAGGWDVDPAVWDMDWGVDIRPFGDGANAIKYLGAYVSRAVIGDGRIVSIQGEEVTYRWKDRANGGVIRTETIPGVEFVRRYLLHVLPRGVRSVRHYGFCHPAAKARRQRVAFHSGAPLVVGGVPEAQVEGPVDVPTCPCCDMPMVRRAQVLPPWSARPPPLDRTLIVRSR